MKHQASQFQETVLMVFLLFSTPPQTSFPIISRGGKKLVKLACKLGYFW